jgi:hypothetical protein
VAKARRIEPGSNSIRRRQRGQNVTVWIDLDESPSFCSNIIGCPIENVQIGIDVEAVFEDTGDGVTLPKFRTTLASASTQTHSAQKSPVWSLPAGLQKKDMGFASLRLPYQLN